MERMSLEDPDSLPFYNAKKNSDRRNVVKASGGGGGAGGLAAVGKKTLPNRLPSLPVVRK
jgi:hypothetical protein